MSPSDWTAAPTFLITGATSGLGEAIATQLGQRSAGALGARTADRGAAAAERIGAAYRKPISR